MDIQVTYITVNRRGQPQRDQQRVAGPTVILGRGTQCQIHLPDPRIALQHAQITVSESEATISAETGRLQVNGRALDGAKLNVGDSIEVGPYLLEVEQPPAGVPLAVSVKLVVPLASFTSEGGRRFALQAPRLSKRRLSYLAILGTLLLCLLVPIAPDLLGYSNPGAGYNPVLGSPGSATVPVSKAPPAGAGTEDTEDMVRTVSARLLQTWNPGPVSQAHQPIGAACRACHTHPFVQVRDADCLACHKDYNTSIKEHVPLAELTGPRAQLFKEMRCAECHRDHKGTNMAPRAEDECAACHKDVAGLVAKPGTENATDFYTDHPNFRLSVIDAGKPDAVRRIRQGKPPAAEMVERSNLKFNHQLHLDPLGVRVLTLEKSGVPLFQNTDEYRKGAGKASKTVDAASGQRVKESRVVMQCGDCHQPGEGGRFMVPPTMEKHCQSCHSLAFEPAAPERQAAHGDEEKVMTMLREFYARLVLGDAPSSGTAAPQGLPRMRPGAVLTSQERRASLAAADQRATQAFNELFANTKQADKPDETKPRGVCIKCHEVERRADTWKIAPVGFTRIWMPRAFFTHAKHATVDCEGCHDSRKSEKSGDILMPDIGKVPEAGARQPIGAAPTVEGGCRQCHVGAMPVEGKVTSECAMCHKYHAGKDFWHGDYQAQVLKRGKK